MSVPRHRLTPAAVMEPVSMWKGRTNVNVSLGTSGKQAQCVVKVSINI